jgi:hypothetical protein
MLSTTNIPVTNYSAMIPMLTGNGGQLAWLLPTHCLHSLEKGLPLQRAFRQCVEHVQAMVSALSCSLLALLVPTDCLRPLENWPLFHRAFRQSGGNLQSLRQGPTATGWQLCIQFLIFLYRSSSLDRTPFLSPLKQIEMATSKGPGADKIMNDPAYERTRENMSELGRVPDCVV